MASLHDVLVYLCKHYPHAHELSKARLTKMVYLADWRSSLIYGRQLTDIRWRFNHYGPYVDDVVSLAREDPDFEVVRSSTPFGTDKDLIALARDTAKQHLTAEEQGVLDHVISTTAPKYWDDFIRLVYSTYPMITQPRYTNLDLVDLARAYREGPGDE